MTKRQEEIVESILINFEMLWYERTLGWKKQFTFKGRTFNLFPEDYATVQEIIDIFNLAELSYVPETFHEVAKKYCSGELFLYEACEQLGIAVETFKKILKQLNYVKTKSKKYGPRYKLENFDYVAKKYKSGDYSAIECARLLGIGLETFKKYLKDMEKNQND